MSKNHGILFQLGSDEVAENKYHWLVQANSEINPEFNEKMTQLGFSESFLQLLAQREINSYTAFENYIETDVNKLHDPFLMHDMEKAVERIQAAIMEGEKILVYGDYDADGITSTAIMKETLEMLGADVGYVLPNRFTHGYGPNQALFAEKIEEGYQLIVTVDNGVAGNEAIAFANQARVDVIVTDHHELPPELPAAFCIVHPRFPGSQYPFGELAGAGVAFKLATALLDEVPLELIDLACIGTVADLVSMTGENRQIVKLGLQVMKENQRLGLSQLLKVSKVDLQKVDETSIGFSIGPRLNAIGRLGDPNPAVELMTTFEPELASQLAEELDKINQQRKTIVEEITKEALAQIQPTDLIHLVAGKNWNPGVLGIVAGNIVKKTGRPAIVLGIDEDNQAKGSGRSVEALDLYQMLNTMRDYFTHFGGHAAAIGATLSAEKLVPLKQAMTEYLQEHEIDLNQGASLQIDETLLVEQATVKLAEELKILAPFGTDNPVPNFLVKNAAVSDFRLIGGDHQHVKFSLTDQSQSLDVIGFNFGEWKENLQQPATDYAGALEVNEWNGQKKAQLRLVDFKNQGLTVIDRRAKHTWNQPIEEKETLYLAFQQPTKKIFAPLFGDQIVSFEEQLDRSPAEYQQLVVLDCPDDKETLRKIVQLANFDAIYLYLYSADEAYLNGMPRRELFVKLYQFFAQQGKVDIRFKLKNVSTYLKIPEKLLVFMIHVFSELKFVTIDDGVLTFVETPDKKPFEESEIFQKRLQRIDSEAFLITEDIQTIRNWLQGE